MFTWFVRGRGEADTGVQTRPDRRASVSQHPRPRRKNVPTELGSPSRFPSACCKLSVGTLRGVGLEGNRQQLLAKR